MLRMGMDVLKNMLGRTAGGGNGRQRSGHGETPDLHYFDGDMRGIRTYYDYRADNDLDEFLVDDITWNDLSMDDVFKRVNQGRSTSGEQYLYYALRSPAVTKEEYGKRREMLAVVEQNPDLRLKLQGILTKLGRRRSANTCEAFSPSAHGLEKMFLYLLLVLGLIGSGAAIAFTSAAITPFLILLVSIPIYHEFAANRIETELATVNYSVAMVHAHKKIKKLASPELDRHLMSFYEAGKRLKPISRIGGVSKGAASNDMGNMILGIFNNLLLFDLITYELLKNRLGKYHDEIFCVHEYLGRIDTAVAVASYRKSLYNYAEPQIDFSPSADVRLRGESLVHPLIRDAVPNSIDIKQSLLITGSNASGKSVFLKTTAINAILAQGICTALCDEYSATAFRILSSMAIADNLLSGESYYIAEIKSLKRIADAAVSEQPTLCVIDEVLRGTNTVERISASSELLSEFAGGTTLCLAATHDIELCAMLEGRFRMLHFEETVTGGGEVLFDYRVKSGPATSRNALKLLRSIGFDSHVVDRADERANRYIATGKWQK